jgi:hypothetical protein
MGDDEDYFDYDDEFDEDDEQCGSCQESPCMCSDQEQTSTTFEY